MAVRGFVLELRGGCTKPAHVCQSWGLVSFASMRLLNLATFGVFVW